MGRKALLSSEHLNSNQERQCLDPLALGVASSHFSQTHLPCSWTSSARQPLTPGISPRKSTLRIKPHLRAGSTIHPNLSEPRTCVYCGGTPGSWQCHGQLQYLFSWEGHSPGGNQGNPLPIFIVPPSRSPPSPKATWGKARPDHHSLLSDSMCPQETLATSLPLSTLSVVLV